MFKEEIGKVIITGLTSTLLTMIVMWVTLVQSFITEDQVQILVETRSPYVQDRKILLKNVLTTESLVSDLAAANKEMTATQSIILGKLDIILQQVDGLQARVTTLEERVLYIERGGKKTN